MLVQFLFDRVIRMYYNAICIVGYSRVFDHNQI